MNLSGIASFVVRFHLASVEPVTGEKKWRIKVTYVQDGKETTFEKLEEAVLFMNRTVSKL
jgi:hypothetical protein